MAWFASGTGSAVAVRHQPEKGRRENMRVGGVGVSGGTVTPTLAEEIPGGASGLTVVHTAREDEASSSRVREEPSRRFATHVVSFRNTQQHLTWREYACILSGKVCLDVRFHW